MNKNYNPTLIVEPILEAKIKYLSHLYPNNEWSGVLFVEYKGSIKNEDFVVIAKDLYLMDIGSSTFTAFESKSASYFKYMVENNLEDCDFGLIHTHHTMKAFFSTTDSSELNSTGKTRDIYVSLIVNNKGEYCAKVSQRVIKKAKVNWTVNTGDTVNNENSTVIEDLEIKELNIYDLNVIGAVNSVIDTQVKSASKSNVSERLESGYKFKTSPILNPPKSSTPKPPIFQKNNDFFEFDDIDNFKPSDSERLRLIEDLTEDVLVQIINNKSTDLEEAIETIPSYLKTSKNLSVYTLRNKLNTLVEDTVNDPSIKEYDIKEEELLENIAETLDILLTEYDYAIFRILKSCLYD